MVAKTIRQDADENIYNGGLRLTTPVLTGQTSPHKGGAQGIMCPRCHALESTYPTSEVFLPKN